MSRIQNRVKDNSVIEYWRVCHRCQTSCYSENELSYCVQCETSFSSFIEQSDSGFVLEEIRQMSDDDVFVISDDVVGFDNDQSTVGTNHDDDDWMLSVWQRRPNRKTLKGLEAKF